MRPLKIQMITPAASKSLAGNRATATRWARMLRSAGHRVSVSTDYSGNEPDLMLALHAWRSFDAIRRFRQDFPGRPLIVALTGTDIYRFQETHPEQTGYSMDVADALIGLHDRVHEDIAKPLHGRLYTVYQSAKPLPRSLPPVRSWFDVCVVGHLREEKDSLRAALAARELPKDSRVRVLQVGKAHNDEWRDLALREMERNPRYRWRGEVPRWQVRRLMARSRLMVMSSIMEGGANAVSEACVAGLPVIASDIPGNRGLLGDDYPGYYPVKDTVALSEQLRRAERSEEYLERLRRHCADRAQLFSANSEQRALLRVVNEVCRGYGIE